MFYLEWDQKLQRNVLRRERTRQPDPLPDKSESTTSYAYGDGNIIQMFDKWPKCSS